MPLGLDEEEFAEVAEPSEDLNGTTLRFYSYDGNSNVDSNFEIDNWPRSGIGILENPTKQDIKYYWEKIDAGDHKKVYFFIRPNSRQREGIFKWMRDNYLINFEYSKVVEEEDEPESHFFDISSRVNEVNRVTQVYDAVTPNNIVTLKNSKMYIALWQQPNGLKRHKDWDKFYKSLFYPKKPPTTEKEKKDMFDEKWGMAYSDFEKAVEKCEYLLFVFSRDKSNKQHLHGWLFASERNEVLAENWQHKFPFHIQEWLRVAPFSLNNYIQIVALATARDENLDDSYYSKQGADGKKHYYFGYMLVLLFEYFAKTKLEKVGVVLESVEPAIMFFKEKMGYRFSWLTPMNKWLPWEENFDQKWFDVMRERRVGQVASAALKLTNGNVQASALLTYSNLLRLKQMSQ